MPVRLKARPERAQPGAPRVDPFQLFAKAAAPADECRNIAARMRAFATDEGNLQYLRKLIYEDSATLASMIPAVEAAAGASSEITRDFYQATSICGSVGECSGNLGMWPLVTMAADAIDAAMAVVGNDGGTPIQVPPSCSLAPVASQEGDTLTCTPGVWTGTPTGYDWQWRIDGVEAAEGATWTVVAVAVGRTADCLVTATNAAGSAAVTSNSLTILPVAR